MAEVGVLNLTIKDNSEQAGQGLNILADALTAVKTAVKGGLGGMSAAAGHLEKLSAAVAENSRAMNSIGSLLNAVTAYSKAFKDTNKLSFNVKPIEDLKAAIGDGVKLGNAGTQLKNIRDAMNGEWNTETAYRAAFSMSSIASAAGRLNEQKAASVISKTADALNKYFDAMQRAYSSSGAHDISQQVFDGMGSNAGKGQMKLNLQLFGGKANDTSAEGLDENFKNVESTVQSATEGMATVNSTIQEATASTNDLLNACSGVTEQTRYTSEQIQEMVRLRKEENRLADEARNAKNYESYRDLFLHGGEEWERQIPNITGLTPESIRENETYADALKQTMDEVDQYVDRFIESMNQPTGPLLSDAIQQAMDAKLAMKAAQQSAAILKNAPVLPEKMEQVQETTKRMSASFDGAKTNTRVLTENLSDLDKELKQKRADMDDAGGAAESLKKRFSSLMFGSEGLNGAFKRMFPTLTGLLKRFKSMTIMRAMRYLIRQISAGFSEGVQNVYQYSKAVGTNLAPSMDSAASSLLQFKNSIGAMAAPLIQALVPALQTIINWVITAINYLNQFFALLNGQTTWTRALPAAAEAFESTEKAANGAGSAVKDLLADWDELNIIQSNSGGGGGGSAGKDVKDYASMFEEVGKFDSELQGIVDGIKEEFGSIWNLAKKIGIALLGWKISNAFAGILGTLGGLLSALGIIDLEFHISTLLNNRYLETGEVGYLVADLLQTLLGSVLMKKVLGKVLGGSLASLAIPIVFTVSALGGIKALVTNTDVSALSEEGILSALNTAIKGGVAAGGLLYSLAGVTLGTSLGVGAGAALFTFGATIGIKAIADTIDAGAITGDTIKANLLSAGTIGAGLALTEAILGGTAATIATVGLGGALLVLGALFAIEAVIASKPKNVRWGSYKATEKEIKAFVEGEVFTVSPNTIISVMNPVIQLSKEKDEALTASVDEVKLTVAKLTIGINESDTLSSLEEQIFGNSETGTQGLIGKFNESVRQKQSVIETGILIEPVATNGDNGEAKQIIDESSEGWKKLTDHMDDLGKRLSEHIAEAYKEGITDEARAMELRTIQELTGMMANVSAAITQGEAEEKAFRVLNEQLTGLTQGSWDQMFAYIEEYKTGITSAYTDAYDAVTDAMAGEVAGLRQSMENALELAGGNENDAKYKEYKAEYERMKERLDARRAGRDKAIDDYADKAMNTETMARIRKTLSGMIEKGAIDKTDINSLGLQDIVGGPEFMNTIWKTLFDEHGIDKGGAKEQMSTWFDRMIDAAFGSDAETIKNAIKLGFLDYGDVISKDVIDQFANVIGITDSPELVNAWNELINSMLIQGDSDIPVYDLELGVDNDVTEPIRAPGVDSSSFNSSLIDMQKSAKSAVDYIKSVIESLNNFSVNVSVTGRNKAPEGGLQRYMQTRASGGFVRSGDLVMANENGNFEMMGRMGNQPVVANNQQIVNGISQGVTTANGDVVSELRTLNSQIQKLMSREFVAKAVPSASWGNHNSKSNSAWDRVTGNA